MYLDNDAIFLYIPEFYVLNKTKKDAYYLLNTLRFYAVIHINFCVQATAEPVFQNVFHLLLFIIIII